MLLHLQISSDCRYLQTTVYFELAGEKFTYSGKQLIDPGYTTLMTWQALTSDEKMPDFTREQMCTVNDVSDFISYFQWQFSPLQNNPGFYGPL